MPLTDYKSVLLTFTKFEIERIILLLDKKSNADDLKILEKSIGKVITIKTIKIQNYDIIHIITKCVKVIDSLKNDFIYVNVKDTTPISLGLLFASFKRHKVVEEIIYEDVKKMILLPKLNFNLNKSEKIILGLLNKDKSTTEIIIQTNKKIVGSRVYQTIDSLIKSGLVKKDGNLIKITEAGQIARI